MDEDHIGTVVHTTIVLRSPGLRTYYSFVVCVSSISPVSNLIDFNITFVVVFVLLHVCSLETTMVRDLIFSNTLYNGPEYIHIVVSATKSSNRLSSTQHPGSCQSNFCKCNSSKWKGGDIQYSLRDERQGGQFVKDIRSQGGSL